MPGRACQDVDGGSSRSTNPPTRPPPLDGVVVEVPRGTAGGADRPWPPCAVVAGTEGVDGTAPGVVAGGWPGLGEWLGPVPGVWVAGGWPPWITGAGGGGAPTGRIRTARPPSSASTATTRPASTTASRWMKKGSARSAASQSSRHRSHIAVTPWQVRGPIAWLITVEQYEPIAIRSGPGTARVFPRDA